MLSDHHSHNIIINVSIIITIDYRHPALVASVILSFPSGLVYTNTFLTWLVYSVRCCSSLPAFQLYRTGPDGDGPLQIAEDTATQQRSYLLLFVPDLTRAEVHSFCQCAAQRPEALQPSHQHHL